MTQPTATDKARIGQRIRVLSGLFLNQTGTIVGVEPSTPVRFRVEFDLPVQLPAAGTIRSAWLEGNALEDVK
jgi:hypothetical protein